MIRTKFPGTIFAILVPLAALVGSSAALAGPILNSANADCFGSVFPVSQPNVETAFQTACGTAPAAQLYKSDFGGSDGGDFAVSYATTFGGLKDDPEDPTTALIAYILGQPSIDFENVWVLAKDGNHDPSYYGWDISGWNGTDAISIMAWDDQRGAISNVSIWGHTEVTEIPEPGTLVMLGAGLFGLGFSLIRRRRAV